MGAYANSGERLIERGFAAIPIVPGTKKARLPARWRLDRLGELAATVQSRRAAQNCT